MVAWLVACTGPGPAEPVPPDPCEEGEPGVICTIAGIGEAASNGEDLPAAETALYLPTAVTWDPEGRLLIDDFNNMRIRRLTDAGTLETLAGTGSHAYAFDGIAADETGLENPIDVAVAADGTLYVSELHGARVLQVDPTGWLTAFAGSPTDPGYPGFGGDGGPARDAQFGEGQGLAVGPDGTVYLADTGNHRIRTVTSDGSLVQTVAGGGDDRGYADGIGGEARFNEPQGITLAGGYLYVADSGNHAIRRLDLATSEVTTVAGTGASGFSGDGGPATEAQLYAPSAVEVGPDGELYIADLENHVVRRVGADGVIETIAGIPEDAGYNGDGIPPEEAQLSRPYDVALSPDGDLMIVDQFNARVRIVRGLLER